MFRPRIALLALTACAACAEAVPPGGGNCFSFTPAPNSAHLNRPFVSQPDAQGRCLIEGRVKRVLAGDQLQVDDALGVRMPCLEAGQVRLGGAETIEVHLDAAMQAHISEVEPDILRPARVIDEATFDPAAPLVTRMCWE